MPDNVLLDSMTGGETVATDLNGANHVQWVKLYYGGDNSFTAVEASTGLPVVMEALNATYVTSEAQITVGTTVFNVFTARGSVFGRSFSVTNDGGGDVTVEVSNDGVGYSGAATLKAAETFAIDDIRVHSIRIGFVSANADYRIRAY